MEAWWQAGHNLCDASFQFVDSAAFITVEMVMMLLARHLIPRGRSWDFNAQKPVVLDHRLKGQEERRADPGVRTALFGPIFIVDFYVGPRTAGVS
jgi:hypothetical protein